MERAKVIVHMYVSIDGKIDGDFDGQPVAKASGDFYSQRLFQFSPANANGITTTNMYAAKGKLDLSQFDGSNLTYEDWVPADSHSETYDVCFDRHGKAGWEHNYFDYGGHKSRTIEVLTEQASNDYLAFLRSMDIPYLVCGKDDLDLAQALVKLKQQFDLSTIALCGGATINGAFLRAGLVDEISLVVAPLVSGDNQVQAAFNTRGQFVNQRFIFQSADRLPDGGVHLLFAKA
ncbi:dihydrofolate reductase family protein [uncultured Limosilactobacillus sp.]|uniref:dihydrofolate reductase family protein n=1 Tax=uncultured Limosilactobacillus sp. TaxID=2837629 RepID=UPI0025DDCF78|nr:dihydrofolate reductase family protein [uncultured Limosilactobacillus sp.]